MSDGPLSKYEMACLTAQVPMTGDRILDSIISTSLRLRIATDVLNGMLASGDYASHVTMEQLAARAEVAIAHATALLNQFASKPNVVEKPEAGGTNSN